MRYKIRRQRRVPGGRVPAYVGLHPDTEKIVQDTMRRFHVTRSMVLSVMADEAVGNPERESLTPIPKSGVIPSLKLELIKGAKRKAS